MENRIYILCLAVSIALHIAFVMPFAAVKGLFSKQPEDQFIDLVYQEYEKNRLMDISAPEEAAARAGMASVPAGMERLAAIWKAPLPDYTIGEGSRAPESLQYVLTAIVGVFVTAFVFLGLGKWQRMRMRRIEDSQE